MKKLIRKGEEGNEEEGAGKDKRARWTAVWADLKWGCRGKKRSIPKLRSSSGATVDEPTEALEELAKRWGELGKQQSNYGQQFAR